MKENRILIGKKGNNPLDNLVFGPGVVIEDVTLSPVISEEGNGLKITVRVDKTGIWTGRSSRPVSRFFNF